jgi:pimeloyl-ACP methyl ester carboxylesterase
VSARPNRPAETTPLRGTVLFVHGLWMTGAESLLLKRHLAACGWALRVFPYSSLAESMDSVARRCARFALALARRTLLPVHLVGHSLGGMVIYRMFETGALAPDRFSGDFCRVVFMGTPVRGSQSARALARSGPGRRLLGAVGCSVLTEGVPERWPFTAQLGIIAGNRPRGLGRLLARFDSPNDGTVAVAETEIEGATDRCVLPVSHSGLWMSTEVAAQVAAFLDRGHFSPEAPALASAR